METAELELGASTRVLCDHFYDEYDDDLVQLRDTAYREAAAENPTASTAKRHALGLARLLNFKRVAVRPYDILAGHGQHVDASSSIPLVYEKRDFDPRVNPRNWFDVKREIDCYSLYKKGMLDRTEQATLTYFQDAVDCGLHKRWGSGHLVAGYADVVRHGYASLEKRIARSLEQARTAEEKDYLEAMAIAVDAARRYIRRYAEEAGAAGEAVKRTNLLRIERACANLSDGAPAADFFEAVQSIWLLHEMLTLENVSGSMSLGRLDQLLHPYYREDLAAGRITPDEAQTVIEALWLKFAGIVQGFQNVTLGGCDAAGEPAVNDVTLFCLRASRKLKRDQPLVCLRWPEKGMPDSCWDEARKLIVQGGGFPALFNDEIIVQARRKQGVDLETARDYGLIGCVEPTAPGKEYSNTEELRVNWAKVLELMLSGGVCRVTGRRVSLKRSMNLKEITSFGEFLSWYEEELEHSTLMGMNACNLLDESYPLFFPSPMLSATVRDSIEKAQDASAGGARYRFSTANACGMANVVDSLCAIRRLVFEQERITLPQLAETLERDFAGHEDLRVAATERCPKFGNDEEEPDSLMRRLVDLFCRTVTAFPNRRGERFQVGLYTVDDQANMGRKTGALPDGRRLGLSLANAINPVQGADRFGPTAVINSVTRLDFTEAGNGMVLDLKFHPDFIRKPAHQEKLRPLVETYFAKGGMEIQFNVVSRETLLAAQRDPASHRNLVVRVSGFSAYFVLLDKVLQDEIIKRTELNGF